VLLAQTAGPAPPIMPTREWQFSFAPYLWATRVGANLAVGPVQRHLTVDFVDIPSRDRAAHLAAMKARTDEPAALSPMTIDALFPLARPPRASTRAQLAEISALENRGVSVTGFVARVAPQRDGDFHIQITAQPPRGCLRHTTSDQLI